MLGHKLVRKRPRERPRATTWSPDITDDLGSYDGAGRPSSPDNTGDLGSYAGAGRPSDHQIPLKILDHVMVQGDHLITHYHRGSWIICWSGRGPRRGPGRPPDHPISLGILDRMVVQSERQPRSTARTQKTLLEAETISFVARNGRLNLPELTVIK